MQTKNKPSMFKNFKDDMPASVVVFLVAMPLCLGIAMASGAPLFSGIISGFIGGTLVGMLSGSPLGVSGPAAGLAVIVANSITDFGSFSVFLVALIVAGIIQLVMGFAKAGIIAYFFPSSVIHGMLAGIGIIIFLKQIPHALGYDKDPEGDWEFHQFDGHNTFEGLASMLDKMHPGVIIITFISLALLILWDTSFFKKMSFTKIVQGPLVVVALGIFSTTLFSSNPTLAITGDHLVNVPIAESASMFFDNFSLPDFRALSNYKIYTTAIVIAVVASLETLLCVEATDKQDPFKRITPTNRELKAQGVGNIIAGLIGGLPVTQVIVRSSTNQQSGGKTKLSAILHGILLLISVAIFPHVLNMIPLGVLAAILLVVGYKLAKPALFKKMYREGIGQFIPFIVTIFGIIFSDLLIGVGLGLLVAVFIILRNNFRIPFNMQRKSLEGQDIITIELSQDVTFVNKASILNLLRQIPDDTFVTIDASNTLFIHQDVLEIIEDFKIGAKMRNIQVKTIDLYTNKQADNLQHFRLLDNKK